jgi:hypothetical protein
MKEHNTSNGIDLPLQSQRTASVLHASSPFELTTILPRSRRFVFSGRIKRVLLTHTCSLFETVGRSEVARGVGSDGGGRDTDTGVEVNGSGVEGGGRVGVRESGESIIEGEITKLRLFSLRFSICSSILLNRGERLVRCQSCREIMESLV